MFKRFWSSRHLAKTLTRRAYQIRYRQSLAGFAWAIIPPLGLLIVSQLVFNKVAGLGSDRAPDSLVTMAAVVPWGFFAASLTAGIPVIYGSSSMITRLSFPRVALPLSVVATSLISFGISTLLFVVLALVTGYGVPTTVLWLPILLLLEVVLILGLVLLGSALDVFARDVRLAVPLLMQLWLLITPVMYPLESVGPELRGWYELNPMTGLVETFRQVLVYGETPTLALLGPSLIAAAVLFAVGSWYFHVTEQRFADVV